jgi:hypothetical protein
VQTVVVAAFVPTPAAVIASAIDVNVLS